MENEKVENQFTNSTKTNDFVNQSKKSENPTNLNEKSDSTKFSTKDKKMKSRKFIVWIVATIFELAFIVIGLSLGKTELAQDFIVWWGSISLVYIGGNVAQKFAFEHKK